MGYNIYDIKDNIDARDQCYEDCRDTDGKVIDCITRCTDDYYDANRKTFIDRKSDPDYN